MKYINEVAAASEAVRQAARLCSRIQNKLSGTDTVKKKDESPVTIADFGSQAAIILKLLETFPNDSIVGEESAGELRKRKDLANNVTNLVRTSGMSVSTTQIVDAIDLGAHDTDFKGRFWTLDPIDGTKGFLRGDQFAIALALIENGEVKIGVLGCPNFPPEKRQNELSDHGRLYIAVKGEGAFCQSLSGGIKKRIKVDAISDIRMARLCESVEKGHAAHDRHQQIIDRLGIAAQPVRIDSQVKYAAVADGTASIYLRLPRDKVYREKIWDHAAGQIVLEEAGGRVTDCLGNPLVFGLGRQLIRNRGVLASNGRFHSRIVETIKDLDFDL